MTIRKLQSVALGFIQNYSSSLHDPDLPEPEKPRLEARREEWMKMGKVIGLTDAAMLEARLKGARAK